MTPAATRHNVGCRSKPGNSVVWSAAAPTRSPNIRARVLHLRPAQAALSDRTADRGGGKRHRRAAVRHHPAAPGQTDHRHHRLAAGRRRRRPRHRRHRSAGVRCAPQPGHHHPLLGNRDPAGQGRPGAVDRAGFAGVDATAHGLFVRANKASVFAAYRDHVAAATPGASSPTAANCTCGPGPHGVGADFVGIPGAVSTLPRRTSRRSAGSSPNWRSAPSRA